MKNLAAALVKAQGEMSNPTKGNTNPFFNSKYADLNAVREAVIPVLNANGISVLQPIKHIDGKNFVVTILLHESGELMESFTEIVYNKQNDAQAQGSGITYARRYGLQSFVCVGADDDDGNKAIMPSKEDIVLLKNKLNPLQKNKYSSSFAAIVMAVDDFKHLRPTLLENLTVLQKKIVDIESNRIKDRLKKYPSPKNVQSDYYSVVSYEQNYNNMSCERAKKW